MDKKAASALIRETLESPFDKERYKIFAKNLLNTIDESKAFTLAGQYIPEKFRDFVKSYERIGTYTDPEGMKVDVLIVNLKSEHTLARARTAQRNFVANYLKERDEKDAGLIAFVSPNPEDWRFSFVKMDYQLVEEKGKVKAKEDLTPARRYSFLVGTQESSHTAQQQLLPILADDTHNPMLAMIEKAFSIETVTKEFFEKYRELFLRVKEALDALIQKDKTIRADFEQKGVNTADFCKKLLGQIVFLYFLQKKGWFGVERDAEWGSGPKNFLRQLFKGELTSYKNFFNDVLEPLFYEALATQRDENFYSKFDCKIPFLNGGLFDPINGYDWIHTDITLPNELFSNTQKTKEGDTGTGILDMFDRYNFTVKEDEPLEKEVAVDPEMLGKVFENLLEVKDRKSKGTYYTPREIVHYMCQESLINYLSTELGDSVPREDISLFIQIGDTVAEHESRVVSKGKETSSYTHKLPESIRKHAAEIDRKLQDIRVCDPAIGSGAFPVGMMNEIVRARQTLTSYLGGNGDRTPYDFKRHAIQECLYGVDIDPGAVEIAKLRLWLSLVVDEDDIGHIKPLPNLDYRIMQGNSLLEEYEGIKLFDEKLLGKDVEGLASELEYARQRVKDLQKEYFALSSEGKLTDVRKQEIETEVKQLQKREKELMRQPEEEKMTGMFDAPSKAKDMYEQLKKLHQDFFEATHREKKKKLKEQIENLEWELIETSLREQSKTKTLNELKKMKMSNVRPFFLWQLHFAEVFSEKKGFDLVIGNPPYVRIQEIPKNVASLLKRKYTSSTGKFDLSVCFIEKGYLLLTNCGFLCFINPNKFISSSYGKGIKEMLANQSAIYKLVNFGHSQNFETATTYTCILFLSKKKHEVMFYIEINKREDVDRLVFGQKDFQQFPHPKSEDDWSFDSKEIAAIASKLHEYDRLDNYCDEIFQGLISGGDNFFIMEYKSNDDEYFVGRSLTDGNEYCIEYDLCYYLLKGAEIERYAPLKYKYIIVYPYQLSPDGSTDIICEDILSSKYPKAFEYLLKFKKQLSERGSESMEYEKWYSLWCPRSLSKFKSHKILTQVLARNASYTLDQSGKTMFVGGGTAGGYGVIPESKIDPRFLLGLLNSKLFDALVKRKSTIFRGGFYAYARRYLEQLPFKQFSSDEQSDVIEIVDIVLDKKKKDVYANTKDIEKKIDDFVFGFFGMSKTEIAAIEDFLKTH